MTTPGEPHQTAEAWTPTLETFGSRLAAIRQKLGWNVKEAAVACGLPPENWRRWEQENIEPRRLITIAMVIATRTGVDLDWLVYGPARASKPGSEEVNSRKLSLDPLAPRVVAPVGRQAEPIVTFGDRRRTHGRRQDGRSGRNHPTSTTPTRSVSLPAYA